MSEEEEELQAALTAANLAWSGGELLASRYYVGPASGCIFSERGYLCDDESRNGPGICPKCALIWYREVRDG